MRFVRYGLVTLLFLALVSWIASADQSCSPGSCEPDPATPFTHIYPMGSESDISGSSGGRAFEGLSVFGSNYYYNTVQNGSITGLSCVFEFETTIGTAGTIDVAVETRVLSQIWTNTITPVQNTTVDLVATSIAGVFRVNSPEHVTLAFTYQGSSDAVIERWNCFLEVTGTL